MGSVVAVLGFVLSTSGAWAGEPPAAGAVPAAPQRAADAATASRSSEGAKGAWITYETTGVSYEQPRFVGDAQLLVRDSSPETAGPDTKAKDSATWRVYRGLDLAAIVKANDKLASAPYMAALRSSVEADAQEAADPAQVTSAVRTSVEAPGLTYEQGTTGGARLFVLEPTGRETLYTGDDLEKVVSSNPSLADLPGFKSFRSRVEQMHGIDPLVLRQDTSTILIVCHTPDGVVVTSNTWLDGAWTSQKYEGSDMAAVQAAAPALRALLETSYHATQAVGTDEQRLR